MEIEKLEEERSIRCINFELPKRGAKQPDLASTAQIKLKVKDLRENTGTGSFKQYGKLIRRGSLIFELYLQ